MKQQLSYEQIKSLVIDSIPDFGEFDYIVSVSPKGDTVSQLISIQTGKPVLHFDGGADWRWFEFDNSFLIVNSYIEKDDIDEVLLETFDGQMYKYYSLVVDLNNTNNHWNYCSVRTFDEVVFPWDKE